MTTIPKNQSHLAELLAIGRSAVSQQAKRGMPTTSVEAAQAWRKANIDPARRKGTRFDQYHQPRQPARKSPTAAAHAETMLALADTLLDEGKDIAALVPTLRAAMAAVPVPERAAVCFSLAVIRVLAAHVLDALPAADTAPTNDDGTPFYCDGAAMTDDDATAVGVFLYAVSAGEVLLERVKNLPGDPL